MKKYVNPSTIKLMTVILVSVSFPELVQILTISEKFNLNQKKIYNPKPLILTFDQRRDWEIGLSIFYSM